MSGPNVGAAIALAVALPPLLLLLGVEAAVHELCGRPGTVLLSALIGGLVVRVLS